MKRFFPSVCRAALAAVALFACASARADWLFWTVDFDDPQNLPPNTETLQPNPMGADGKDAYVWLTVVNGDDITRLTTTSVQLEGDGNGAAPYWQSFEIDPSAYSEGAYMFFIEIGAQVGAAFSASEGLTYTDLVSAGFIQQTIDPLGGVWNAAGSTWHAVPEPTSALLLLMGGALLALRRRRRAATRAAAACAVACTVCLGARAEQQFHALDVANVVGVAAITNAVDYLPLVAQFGQVSVMSNQPQNAAAFVTNLVFTANLEAGDMLYAYDHVAKGYRAYELDAKKAWVAKTVHDVSVTTQDLAAASYDLRHDWGYGFWIQRANIAERADKTVFLAGQVPMGDVHVTVLGSSGSARGQTLIGNPFGTEWNLNDKTVFNWASYAAVGDRIQLNRSPSRIFQWSATKGWVNKTGRDAAVIPAGESFWYQRPQTVTTGLDLAFPAVLPR